MTGMLPDPLRASPAETLVFLPLYVYYALFDSMFVAVCARSRFL